MNSDILKMILVIFINNSCLSFKTCNNKCPLKCGFSMQKYRCFFDIEVPKDVAALAFSESVFEDKGKSTPLILQCISTYSCDHIDSCKTCGAYQDNHCKIFKTFNSRIK